MWFLYLMFFRLRWFVPKKQAKAITVICRVGFYNECLNQNSCYLSVLSGYRGNTFLLKAYNGTCYLNLAFVIFQYLYFPNIYLHRNPYNRYIPPQDQPITYAFLQLSVVCSYSSQTFRRIPVKSIIVTTGRTYAGLEIQQPVPGVQIVGA